MINRKKIQRSLERLKHQLSDLFSIIENLWIVPAGWMVSLWHFAAYQFWRWQNSRSFRSFVLGLPAVLVTGIVGYVSIVAVRQSKPAVADRYDRQAQAAVAANDFRYSRLCLERLIQLRGEDSQTLMRLAEIYATQKDNRRVTALMTRLAPADRLTIPEAHLWRARSLLSKRDLTREELDEVEQQLGNTLKLRPQDAASRSLLGQVYAQTGRPKEAVEMFKRISNRSAGDSFRLAEISSGLGDDKTAIEAAEDALIKYQNKLKEDYRSWPDRQNVVKAQVYLERFEDAVETLRESTDAVEPKMIRETLAKVYGTWTQALQQQRAEVPKRIAIIELALRVDPNSKAAYDSLADLLSVADQDELVKLRVILQRMLATGQSAPLVHFCIGTDAILHDNLPDGIKHLQLAYQGDPALVAAANNLAWAMAQAESPPLDQALSLIDSVLVREPEIAAVRDTRGQILLKLKRWDEAITELERALRGMPKSDVTRQGLIQAYEAVGLNNLADEHRKVLALLSERKTAGDSEP